MTAAIIAEALAAAERETEEDFGGGNFRAVLMSTGGAQQEAVYSLQSDQWRRLGIGFSEEGWDAGYVRHDVFDTALRHLAERAERAEAERATLAQAIRRVRDEVTRARDGGTAQYLAHKHTYRALVAVGEDPHKGSGAYAEKGAPRG